MYKEKASFRFGVVDEDVPFWLGVVGAISDQGVGDVVQNHGKVQNLRSHEKHAEFLVVVSDSRACRRGKTTAGLLKVIRRSRCSAYLMSKLFHIKLLAGTLASFMCLKSVC